MAVHVTCFLIGKLCSEIGGFADSRNGVAIDPDGAVDKDVTGLVDGDDGCVGVQHDWKRVFFFAG